MSAVATSGSRWMPIRARWGVGAAAAVSMAAAAGFLATRAGTALPYPSFQGACERLRTAGLAVTPQDWFCLPVPWSTHAAYTVALLLMAVGFVIPGVILAASGRRLVALVPLLLVPATKFQSVIDSNRWWVGSWRTGTLEANLATAVLLAAPVVAVMLVRRDRRPPRRAVPVVACAATWIAVALPSAGIIWMTEGMYVRHYEALGGTLGHVTPLIPAAIAIGLFGALLGPDRRWWPWGLVVTAVFMSAGPSGAIITGPGGLQDWSGFGAVVPLFAVGLVCSAWRPIADRMTRLIGRRDVAIATFATALLADRGRLRPTVVANAVAAGLLLVSLVMFRADPLPAQVGTALPTYLGARTSVADLRTRQLLRQALSDMDGFRSEHGTYRGFDVAAATSVDPELAWQQGLPHGSEGTKIPELTMDIVGASGTTARLVAVSPSGTAICIQRDPNGITYGTAPRRSTFTPAPNGPRRAVDACGSTPWTAAAVRPFPMAAMCDGLDRDGGYMICRMVQVIMVQTLQRTGPE